MNRHRRPSGFRASAARGCASAAVVLCLLQLAAGQAKEAGKKAKPAGKAAKEVPQKVEVNPVSSDEEIAARLTRILKATGWYEDLGVRVDEGVVFLTGSAQDAASRDWAARLAGKTQDVVAVVNRLETKQRPMWDFSPAWQEIRGWTRSATQAVPKFIVAVVLLALTWLAIRVTRGVARRLLKGRMESPLLRQVTVLVVGLPVLIIGVYIVLRISGLTGLAATVLGGTGLLGLIVGIAFRDIAENFLASLLISMQRPFHSGDLIEVGTTKGYVQQVTTRGTVLMTLQGNHVQIPNSTVYKSIITNFSANPNVRLDFAVGIGYDDSVTLAQDVAAGAMREHPAVLEKPESFVVVEQLAAATVNLRLYFWMNGKQNSQFKVKSSVIRQVKRALQDANISLPDESREIVFPQGVPVQMVSESREKRPEGWKPSEPRAAAEESEEAATSAEGGLNSEAEEIAHQARQSRSIADGVDLLESNGQSAAKKPQTAAK